MLSPHIHLPGINGIRAIAAFIVLIFHIDQFTRFFDVPTLGIHASGMARYGVTLFFVLSGFLITYLLIVEKRNYGKINLFQFYMRRILRIWPLYYLAFGIGLIFFFTYPEIMTFNSDRISETFFLYFFLMANIGYGLGLGFTPITPLWSIGVEEQFYALWPILLNKSYSVLKMLLFIIATYFSIKLCLRIFENDVCYNLVSISCFDSMALGGIGAYLVINKSTLLRYFYNPLLQIFCWGVLAYSIVFSPLHISSVIDNEMYSIFFVVIILNVSTNSKAVIKLEYRLFDFIGKISYGIYILHMPVLLSLALLNRHVIHYHFEPLFSDYALIYAMIILCTLLAAYLSYHLFESQFLRKKTKYTRIVSVSNMPKYKATQDNQSNIRE
jgi:peptidoglycan/LPS O-acetylase OafA/YrhL